MIIYASMVKIPLDKLKRTYTPLNSELTIKEVQELSQLLKIKTSSLCTLIEKKELTCL